MHANAGHRVTGDDCPDGVRYPLPALRGRDSAAVEIPGDARDGLPGEHAGGHLANDHRLIRNHLQPIRPLDVAVPIAPLPAVRLPVHRDL
jgi:hypothetical protein